MLIANMQHSEKLCLKWNDFQENLNTTFEALRNDREFADVTLACEDGNQVQVHRVVLAYSSPFFMDILRKSKHPHPFLYMRGMRASDLEAMVDFLYYGEANVTEENLDNFLLLAEELKLKGLTGSSEMFSEKKSVSKKQKPIPDIKSFKFPDIKSSAEQKPTPPENKPLSKVSVAIASEEDQQLDEQVLSLMETGENVVVIGNNHKQKAWLCKVCGKEGFRANIMTHVEANHISNSVLRSCDICGKNSRSVC